MTHLDDEKTRHVFGLPESAIAVTEVTGVDEDFRDSWYLEYLANSSAGIRTDFSTISLEDAIWAEGAL
ncbi:hypothetical protein LguiA_012271 [Lonicera macranthoides]